jgi:prepilin-type N-terminal cleavage/methylation domain-containing protein
MNRSETGYTLVELLMVIAVMSVIGLGAFDLFSALLHSAIVGSREAVASTLATNQMEYLKSLPYDNLAVANGPIIANSYLPASFTKKVNGNTFTIKTSISYVDNAYDGCGSYPTQALKQQYCNDYPPPSGAPSTDTNPADYKDVAVIVTDKSGLQLSTVDTHIAALVAETSSNTGALFVYVKDGSGNPVTGATVQVTNNTVSPAVNVSDTTDENGIVIFYDLPPSTTNYKYQISASASGYSSLTTIAPNGSLQPTYSSQNLFAQNSTIATMTLYPQGSNSIVLETTDLNGAALPNAKVYVKGGYKKYTATTDTTYYYDTLSPSDTRPVTDANGLAALTNLVPGNYYLCGDAGATSCSIGGATYYLAAAVPYGGVSTLEPVVVPTYDPANPPATTFAYGGTNYLQKVRLMLTTSSTFPRVINLTPSDGSIASGSLASFPFTLTGVNLSGAAVSFKQGASNFAATCSGSATQQNCTVNLSSASAGNTQMIVTVGSNTLTLPPAPLLGGIIVTP